jgi:hypothetical protein
MACILTVPISDEQNKKLWEEIIAYFLWYDTDRIENNRSSYSSVVGCLFAARMCIFSSCLTNNDRGTHVQTHRLMGRIYEVCIWDGLRSQDTLPSLIKIGSGVQKLMEGGRGIE